MPDVTSKVSKFAFRIANQRRNTYGGYALMYFNLNIGQTMGDEFIGLMTVKDFSLMQSKDGEYYVRGPSKPRVKNKQLVEKEGRGVYDDVFFFYAEEGQGKDGALGMTKNSATLRKRLIEDAVATYTALPEAESANAGRGGEYANSTGATAAGLFDEDDQLPF